MNPSRHSHAELLAARIAAGALFALALAFAGAAGAHPPVRVATLTPVGPSPEAAAPERGVMPETSTTSERNLALEAIGMGDRVRVTVFRNPDLTTEARVSDRGTILFPLIGEVPVQGMTPQQVGERIAEKLRRGRYVVNPQVTVSLFQINSRQVSVLGNVNKPGRYPLDSQNVHLTDLLAAAGGVAAPGSDRVIVMSKSHGGGQPIRRVVDLAAMFRNGDLSQNVALQPGDTVYVEKAPMVYIYGEVNKAGAYRLEPHMTVMQVIALGGGVSPRGTEDGVRIERRDGDGRVHRIQAHLTDPVKSDDVVYVRESLF